jgi:tetratricopeptide (TPR) repeat protein
MNTPETTSPAPTVFISYSHMDKEWKDRLVSHLGVSQRQGLLFAWEDRLIGGGEDWFDKIQAAMDAAYVAILLVSANSLTSEFILNEEVKRLLQRRDQEGLRIFPVIIKPCDWEAVPWLRTMNLRPRDGREISGGNEHQIDTDFKEIAREIRQLLGRSASPATGAPRKPLPPEDISVGRLPVTGGQLFGRGAELKALYEAWEDGETHVLSFIAWGGVGKSALVNKWLNNLARDDYRGAEKVYAWSFYRQGTSEQGVSADQFIDAALRWFGDPDPTAGTPWDKGERLARLVRRQRTLLLLDGLEPLQFPPGRGHKEGALKEHSMQALLRELAAHNPGLCVITSRLTIDDLADSEGNTTRRINLEHLSPQAGAAVLRGQGVKGEQAELERASSEFGGHALALTLLGSYLVNVHDGDIARRDRVDILREDEEQGGHARRVMASYEKWFGEGPELSILRILGLFDRPADGPSINALRAAPAIPNLTDALQPLTEEDWRRTLGRLRAAKLIADRDRVNPDTLDAHPLVREYFKQQLKRDRPGAWREGNSRLYEHLRDTTKELPETIDEMSPLYAAVAHGCAANRYQEALDEVYWRRIQRGDWAFNTKNLGAIGAELAILAGFFDVLWLQPVPALNEQFKGYILNEAGYDLRSLGRLLEAVQPMQASLTNYIAQKDLTNASAVAGNLSEVYRTIGDLPTALSCSRQGVKFADESADEFQPLNQRVKLASVLHKIGEMSEARALFQEAEEMQKRYQSNYRYLYSLRSFLYCGLLLDEGQIKEVQERAAWTVEVAKKVNWLFDIALDHLSLGRSYLLQDRREATGDLDLAADYMNRAVDGLRQAGALDYLPQALLARAELCRSKGEFDRARADLNEAMIIATRGGMGLYQADCHLEYARLCLAEGEREKAREHWRTAEEMIERMGYHLRDRDVEEIGREFE